MNYIKTEFDKELVVIKEKVIKINQNKKSKNNKFEWIFLPIHGPQKKR